MILHTLLLSIQELVSSPLTKQPRWRSDIYQKKRILGDSFEDMSEEKNPVQVMYNDPILEHCHFIFADEVFCMCIICEVHTNNPLVLKLKIW